MEISEMVGLQRAYFNRGETKNVKVRRAALCTLKENILKLEGEILDALKADLGKSSFEGYMTEVGMALEELTYMERNLCRFAHKKLVPTPIAQFPSLSYKVPEPYGVVLIMSPWNYPFLLTLQPLIDAIAAGNTAILKPSNYSPETSAVIKKLIEQSFAPEYVSVVEGGRDVNGKLLDEKFDYIFFTGGITVGKLVMEKASKNLTPVSLELGGKSPCIVEKSANLKIAARRIVFGKFLNCGQTCVAPDYLCVDEEVHDELLEYIIEELRAQYTDKPLENEAYGKIINEKHYKRLMGLMENEHIINGGYGCEDELRIAPTIIDDVTLDSPVMKEEIFGPILPVLTYSNFETVYDIIDENPTPLALYLFTKNRKIKNDVLSRVRFGGGCINDTIIHLATNKMGFGGVGQSGMGAYHGKTGFDTFTHYKSIVDKSSYIDIPVRYQPYDKTKEKLLRMLLK